MTVLVLVDCRLPGLLRVGARSVDPRNRAAHRSQIRTELSPVVDRMLHRHSEKGHRGGLHHAQQIDRLVELVARHSTYVIKGGRYFFLVASHSIAWVHDPASIRIVGRLRELTVRDAVQEPFVFKRNVADESQTRFSLRIGPVIETVNGNRGKNSLSRLDLVFEIGDEKVGDRSPASGLS